MYQIELKNVKKTYASKVLFNGINLGINSGDFIGIQGASGSGKSTLLNIIGLLEKCEGHVLYSGREIKKIREKRLLYRNVIGYLFQNYALIDDETVMNNLRIVRTRESKKDFENRVYEALARVGIDSKMTGSKIYQLSGGEQQRVAIARLILADKRIILADEPTGSLDPDNSEKVLELLQQLNTEGRTVILVSHNAVMFRYCTKMLHI